MGGRRRKIGLTDREKRLLATIRRWGDEEFVRRAARAEHGPSAPPRHESRAELLVDTEMYEKLKPLREARKKEVEAKRDQ